jgi:hypothetical protein
VTVNPGRPGLQGGRAFSDQEGQPRTRALWARFGPCRCVQELFGYTVDVARTIWIGDVHGCAAELEELLARIAPAGDDRVIFVGDLVARGPDTRRVLQIARELGAPSVRGNHEQRLIVAHHAIKAGGQAPRVGPSHQKLVRELNEVEWAQLEAMPLHLEFPAHDVLVVHAGVQPGLPLAKQQPWTLLHIRSLTHLGAASERYSPRSWAEAYSEGPHIVFGHNAQAGLGLYPRATGLDSACVYGGRLSALVLQAGEKPPPASERLDAIVSVAAHARYVDYGPAPAAS